MKEAANQAASFLLTGPRYLAVRETINRHGSADRCRFPLVEAAQPRAASLVRRGLEPKEMANPACREGESGRSNPECPKRNEANLNSVFDPDQWKFDQTTITKTISQNAVRVRVHVEKYFMGSICARKSPPTVAAPVGAVRYAHAASNGWH